MLSACRQRQNWLCPWTFFKVWMSSEAWFKALSQQEFICSSMDIYTCGGWWAVPGPWNRLGCMLSFHFCSTPSLTAFMTQWRKVWYDQKQRSGLLAPSQSHISPLPLNSHQVLQIRLGLVFLHSWFFRAKAMPVPFSGLSEAVLSL